jgi:hypothetical protein
MIISLKVKEQGQEQVQDLPPCSHRQRGVGRPPAQDPLGPDQVRVQGMWSVQLSAPAPFI